MSPAAGRKRSPASAVCAGAGRAPLRVMGITRRVSRGKAEMTSDDAMRPSDGDREHAAEMLRNAYAAGRIDLAELHDRAGAAYTATTWGELRALTADLPAGQVRSPGSIGRRIPRRGRPARPRAAAATRCHLGDGCHLACHRRRGAHSSGDPAGPALVVLAARGLGKLGRRVTPCRGPCRPSGCACQALRGLWRSPPRRRCIMPRSSPRPSLSRSWRSRQRRPGRAARRGGLCRLGGAMTLPGPGLGAGSEVWLMPVIYVPWAFPAGSVRSQSPGLPWRAGSLFAIGGDEGRPPTVGLAELIAWARSRKTGAARRSS